MAHPKLRLGCQTFTWEMLGDCWGGSADDLVDAIAAAGYAGIEITDTMIGDYATRPQAFAQRLADAGLVLAAFAFGSDSGFTRRQAIAADLDTTRRWVDFAAVFPDANVSLGSATMVGEGTRDDAFAVAADVYNGAAEIGAAAGLAVSVHPSSHHNTLLFDRADYDRIFGLLDAGVTWVPDTGHMLRGGMDPVEVMTAHRARIRYVHLKDADASGNWAMLGVGACDVRGVMEAAAAAPHFDGWCVVEEESDEAGLDPAAAVTKNRATARGLLNV